MKILICFLLLGFFLSVDTSAQEYKHGVLVEEFTSQYCPFSPRGDHYMDSVCKLMPDNAVALVWHSGYMSDNFTLPAGDSVARIFGIPEVPHILSNRWHQNGVPDFARTDGFYTQQIQIPATEQANIQLAITGETYDSLIHTIACDLRIWTEDTAKLLRDTAQYYVAAVLTEDSVISWQWLAFDGTADSSFHHDNLVRAVGGKIMGDAVSLKDSGVVVRHYVFSVKAGWNPANIKIKAFAGAKYPVKNIQNYLVLNAIQTASNAIHFPTVPKPYAAILQPRAGDTLSPKHPMSIVIDRSELRDTLPVRLFISPDGGVTWDGIGGFDGISSVNYNYPDSFKRKPLQLKITSFDSKTVYAVTGEFYIMGTGKKSIHSVTISGYPNLWIDSTYLITWDYTGDVADIVSIEISDDQMNWKHLFSEQINSGKEGIKWQIIKSDMPCAFLRVISNDGIIGFSPRFTINTAEAVTNTPGAEQSLDQNYPNPFHSSTHIHYTIPYTEEVTLVLNDLLGNEVAQIRSNSYEQEGEYDVIFETEKLESGTYIMSLITHDKRLQRKMVVKR